MPLNTSKLVGLKKAGDKTTAQCPVCALDGRDLHSKDHLVIFSTGKFGCVVDDSHEHSKAIWRLAGDGSDNYDISVEPIAPKVEIDRVWPKEWLERLIPEYTYWKGRGISEETVKPFKGGIAITGQMANRWVFPIFDADDQVIGFTGRALKDSMQIKWKHLGTVGKWVWGGLEEIESEKEIILVESPGDFLALREHGVNNVICLFGVNMSQAVLAYLIGMNPSRIIVSTNFDKLLNAQGKMHMVGQRSAEKIKNTLDIFFNNEKIVIKLPPAKDWGEATKEQIHESFITQTV